MRTAACLCLMMNAGALAPAIAYAQSDADTTPAARLQLWDRRQIELRETIWRTYSAKIAFGVDSRGRSIADDVEEWVMTNELRERLTKARSEAEQRVKTNNDAQAISVLDAAESEVRAQAQLLANVNFYWQSLIRIRLQRDLWKRWIAQSSAADAAQSRALMAPLEASPSPDFPRTATHAEIERWADSLSHGYDAERQKLAAIVSESSVAAGKVMASREWLANCEKAKPRIERHKGPAVTDIDQPVRISVDMSSERFYPAEAYRQGISGSVELRLAVRATGCVERVDVLRSTGADELDQAAMDWAEYVQFLPATHDNKPVAGSYSRTIVFRAAKFAGAAGQSAQSPATASAYVTRGNHSLDQGQYDQAIADFNKAIDLDSQYALAFADRAIAYFWERKLDDALRDLDAAARIDPRNPVVFRGRGLLALEANDLPRAITAFSTSLEIEPNSLFALLRRASAYLRMGEKDKALSDYAASIAGNPKRFELYATRALILRSQGSAAQSLDEASALIDKNPDDASAYRVAAGIYAASGKKDEALKSIDRAIQISPNEQNLLARALYRHGNDPAGEREDLLAALAAKPEIPRTSILLAESQLSSGDATAALDTLRKALDTAQENPELLTARGIVYMKSGQTDLADADFVKARDNAKDANTLNSICWAKATANISVNGALKDCDAAIALSPNASNIHDSRALALLRMGRYEEAVASYDAALLLNPVQAASLYGRGIAEKHLGKNHEADSDIRSALMCDAQIAARFAGYGVEL